MSGTNYIASNWRTPTNQNSSKNDNYSLSFDGSSDFISCGNDPQIQLTGDISISAWFKTSDTNAMVIAAKRYNTLGDAYGWQVYCTAGGKIAFTVTRSGPTTTTATNPSGTNIADGEWHHVLCTINQDSQIAIILDGSTEATAPLPAGTFIDSNSDLIIGKGTALVGPPYYFNGEISEVALFDYLASGATLYGNATSGSGNPMALKPTPVGYWPLGDNSANDPLAQPNVAVEDASVFDFDGANYIETSEINLGLENTISFWAKSDGTDFDGMVWGGISQSNNYTVFLTPTNRLFYRVGTAANQFTDSDIISALGSGDWFHCALVRNNGGADVLCYINGDLKQTITGIVGSSNNTIVKNIGARSTLDFKINGELSNIAIWNSDQSSEISNIYNSGVPATSYTNTPTAWYKLDQSANWEADTAGNWQIPNAVSAYPQSFNFSPADEYVDTGNNPLIGASNLSISAWFNSADVDFQYLLGDTSVRFSIKQSNGDTRITFTGSTDPFRGFGVPYNISEWNHLILTFDGSLNQADRLKLYHNGVEINNINAGTPSTTLLLNTAASFMIGRVGGTSVNTWNGKISNVQLWDVTLDQPEVTTLYNSGTPTLTPPNQSDLKAWWKLDDTALFDNTNWSIENQVNPSNYNSALDFDGGTDVVTVPSISFDMTNNLTLSCWINLGAPSTWDYLCTRGGSGGTNSALNWRFSSGGALYSTYNGSSIAAGVGFTTGGTTWHHLAITYNYSNGDVTIYKDGQQTGNILTFASGYPIAELQCIGAATGAGANSINAKISNFAIWESIQDISELYNNGTPANSYTNTPTAWWKLDNLTTGLQDNGSGGNNATNNGTTVANTFVNTESVTSANMTEQSLVNNNVSTLNGESSGMTSGNLVLSDLTRNLPYENYSLSFDSGTDYVECGNISGLNGGLTEATWSGWFNRSSSGVFYIMGTYGTGQIQFFVLQGNDYVTAYAGNSVGAQRTMSKADVTPWTTGQWYHLTFVYDESESNDADKMKIYIDGVLQANAVAGSSLTSLNSSTASFDIGRLTGTASNQFVGKISNVAIWNNALSSTEAQNLYANGIPQDLTTFTPQPINWWTLGKESFWDGADWIIRDMIGTNDGLSANMGGGELKGDAPRSQANGVGTNIAVPTNLKGEAGWSDKNGYSINMSSTARTTDTP